MSTWAYTDVEDPAHTEHNQNRSLDSILKL